MAISLFTNAEKELLKKIERLNDDELLYWKMPNVIYPFAIILISIIAYIVFKPAEKYSNIGLLNLILNGSLPMVALNRVSSLGSNLFKFNKYKEEKANSNTTSLRVKIDDYSKLLIICIAFLYIYQVINGPFLPSWWIFFQLILSAVFIYHALNFSKYGYLLQERLMEKTYADDIKENALENKRHLFDKYGEE